METVAGLPQLGPQPDFRRLSQKLQEASTDIANIANLAPLTETTTVLGQLLAAMQDMRRDIGELRVEMRREIGELRVGMRELRGEMQQEIRALRTEMRNEMQQLRTELRADIATSYQTAEYNSLARLGNSHAGFGPNVALIPLRAHTTNTEVEGFPNSTSELSSMQAPALNRVLTALSLPTNGTTPEKRQRLKFYAGLPER